MLLDVAVEPPTVVRVRPAHAPDGIPWIEVEMRHCRQDDDGYHVGCMFARTPPWNVLLLFG